MHKKKLPEHLRKYFWDCDYNELNLAQSSEFIAERILNFGEMRSLKWLLSKIDKNFLKQLVNKSRNLNNKTRNLWRIILYEDESSS